MFDRIARVYDPMNTAMSAGLHHRWRSRAADLAGVGPGARVLDVATGTGDLALELAGRVWPGGEVVGADFSEAMLDRARAKLAAPRAGAWVAPRFDWADAMDLPYPDGKLRRGDRRVRRAQLRGPRARPSGDGARRQTRRKGRGARDDHAAAAAAVVLLPRLVRPPGTRPGTRRRRAARGPLACSRGRLGDRGGLHLSAQLGAPLSGTRGARRGDGRAGIAGVAGVLLAGGIIAIHAGTVAPRGRP